MAELSQLLATQLESLLGSDAVGSAADYERLGVLGQTQNSITRLVRRQRDGQLVCIKEVQTDRFPSSSAAESLQEVEILKQLDGHPHCIGFGGAYLESGALSIVMEFADNGTLAGMIDGRRERNAPLRENQVFDVLVQLFSALAHLHSQGIIHRDLKPSNIFFDSRQLVRLGDFGESETIAAAEGEDPRPVGTEQWCVCTHTMHARTQTF